MILSASRRTDIPAFYSEWMMNRLREGHALVQNPRNPDQISRIDLSPAAVDCIVFWTKNPAPFLRCLDEIDAMGYPYYFQFSVTPYGRDAEPGLYDKEKIADTFVSLGEKIGKEKLVWRYDPILLNAQMTPEWHFEEFGRLLDKFAGYTEECVISFVDSYDKMKKRAAKLDLHTVSEQEMRRIAAGFSRMAASAGVTLRTCAEAADLEAFGASRASCIDRKRIEQILGAPLRDPVKKDGQRAHCGCMECVDIGAYDTCSFGCLYCYANHSPEAVRKNVARHDPRSALLIGRPPPGASIAVRKCRSFKDPQIRLP